MCTECKKQFSQKYKIIYAGSARASGVLYPVHLSLAPSPSMAMLCCRLAGRSWWQAGDGGVGHWLTGHYGLCWAQFPVGPTTGTGLCRVSTYRVIWVIRVPGLVIWTTQINFGYLKLLPKIAMDNSGSGSWVSGLGNSGGATAHPPRRRDRKFCSIGGVNRKK